MDTQLMIFCFIGGAILIATKLFSLFFRRPSTDSELIVYNAARTSVLSASLVGLYFCMCYLLATCEKSGTIIGYIIVMLLLGMTVLRFALMAISIFWKDILWLKRYEKRKNVYFWICLLNLFIFLLIAGSMLNYVMLVVFPAGFECAFDLSNNCYYTGFECLHYTFTLITTSGNPSVAAVCPVSKVLEMVEMLVFYLVFGWWLTSLMADD